MTEKMTYFFQHLDNLLTDGVPPADALTLTVESYAYVFFEIERDANTPPAPDLPAIRNGGWEGTSTELSAICEELCRELAVWVEYAGKPGTSPVYRANAIIKDAREIIARARLALLGDAREGEAK